MSILPVLRCKTAAKLISLKVEAIKFFGELFHITTFIILNEVRNSGHLETVPTCSLFQLQVLLMSRNLLLQ